MQRLTRYIAGWVVATALATGVSWVAIQNLVTTAALSQPAGPLVAAAVAAPLPTGAATGPAVTPSARTATESTPPTRTAKRPDARTPTRTPSTRTSSSPANDPAVQGYSMKGGQIVLEVRPDSAALVSAIPAADYRTETWKTEYWFRVDFVNGDRRSSMIVSWYNHPPWVEKTEF